jgi:hypothetical protein
MVVCYKRQMSAALARWQAVLGRLPVEIRLAGWLGPSLFTSEVRDGRLVPLYEFDTELHEHTHARSMVIGTVREAEGFTPAAYAAFCVDPRTGIVVLVDLDAPFRVRFVNSGPEEFLASLAAFVAGWPRLARADEALASTIDQFRLELAGIDAAAFSDADAFWPTSLETYTQ